MADLELVGKLARSTMDEHGLTDWTFKWDRAIRRWGSAHHCTREITLSRSLVSIADDDDPEIMDTILHEIAHALCAIGEGHGPEWKSTVARIGGRPQRIATTAPHIPRKWRGTCPNGHVTLRDRRSKVSCGRCSSKFDRRYMIVWIENK